jgi:hypothetical protein
MKKTVLSAMVFALAAFTSNANATSGYDKKFYISSDDGAYTLSPGMMVGTVWSHADTGGTVADKFSMSNARVWLAGNWTDAFSYNLTFETVFPGATGQISSAYGVPAVKYANVTHNLGVVKLRFGLQKVAIGGDHQENPTAYQFVGAAGANQVGANIMAGKGDTAGGFAVMGSTAGLNYHFGVWENNEAVTPTVNNNYDMSFAVDYTAMGKMSEGMSDLTGERSVLVGAGQYYHNDDTVANTKTLTAIWLKYKGGGYSFGVDYNMGKMDTVNATGTMVRVGKVFGENHEVALRMDMYDATDATSGQVATTALAYNHFFNGENAKVTAEYDMSTDDTSGTSVATNTMYLKYHIAF